ncbi:hypothetical protein BB559_003669 [Furculomyces boomerangus]|uniref:THO complex subunit 2 n=1 Tax=Furculomyces boomerangus TaxID=61424 RepID=A0A2T9YJN6_9FUNG|nr:hypothetical protein BB559_003669 [Furculomyces boomerangus]
MDNLSESQKLYICVFELINNYVSNESDGNETTLAKTSKSLKDLYSKSDSLIFQDAIIDIIWAIWVDLSINLETKNSTQSNIDINSPENPKEKIYSLIKFIKDENIIDLALVKERLNPELLQKTGIVLTAQNFNKKIVRANTNNQYKQTKFNLLRETSIGYSRVVSITISSMISSYVDPYTTVSYNNTSSHGIEVFTFKNSLIDSSNFQKHIVQNIISNKIIENSTEIFIKEINRATGMYSLDPNRIADLILDIFVSNFKKYWPFFLSIFFKCGFWNLKEPSLLLTQLICNKITYHQNFNENNSQLMSNEIIVASALLSTYNVVDMSVLYTHLSPNDDELFSLIKKINSEKSTPSNAGFSLLASMTSLDDLGFDEGEEDHGNDTSDKTKNKEESKKITDSDIENPNLYQKCVFCMALLSLGDLASGFALLKKFKGMNTAFPLASDHINYVLFKIVEIAYAKNSKCFTPSLETVSSAKINSTVSSRDLQKKLSATPFPPLHSKSRTETQFFYDFFWEKGYLYSKLDLQNLPQLLEPWISMVGPLLSRNTKLLNLLLRICWLKLSKEPKVLENPGLFNWTSMLKSHLLPAISTAKSNPAIINELWKIIGEIPFKTRYSLYDEWKINIYNSSDEMKSVKKESESKIRSVLRRLSRDTVKSMGRKLCKVCHMNPLVVIPLIVERICHDDNLIEPLIEAFRFLTPMGIDVSMYSVVEILFSDNKSRVKENGTDLAHWLTSLCSFTSLLLRRFHRADPGYLLTLLSKKLGQVLKNSSLSGEDILFEYEILSEFLIKLATIEPMYNPSKHQLHALQGGLTLRNEAYQMAGSTNTQWQESIRLYIYQLTHLGTSSPYGSGPGGNHSSGNNNSNIGSSSSKLPQPPSQKGRGNSKSTFQLVKSLLENETFIPLLVGLSKQTQQLIHGTENNARSLKTTMTLYDNFHIKELQFANFVTSYVLPLAHSESTLNPFSKLLIPSISSLHQDYGLSWQQCWMWTRPAMQIEFIKSLKHWAETDQKIEINSTPSIQELESRLISNNDFQDPSKCDLNQVSIIEESSNNESSKTVCKNSSGLKDEENDLENNRNELKEVQSSANGDTDNNLNITLESQETNISQQSTFKSINREVSNLSLVIEGLPQKTVEYCRHAIPSTALTNGFLPEFYVVFWMLNMYDLEVPVDRYNMEINRLEMFIKTLSNQFSSNSSSISNSGSKLGLGNMIKEKEKALTQIETLLAEQKEQSDHVDRVMKWLGKQKDYWFCMANDNRTVVADYIFQSCVFPRAIHSALDALYVAKFVLLLQYPLSANMFPTLILSDRIFSNSLSSIIESLTEDESINYSRFLNSLLGQFQLWHSDCELYREQCIGDNTAHGFVQKWSFQKGIPLSKNDMQCELKNMLTHENFIRVHFKWHTILFKVFSTAIKSNDADLIRKALLGLRMLSDTFPATLEMGTAFLGILKSLVLNSNRLLRHDYHAIALEFEDKDSVDQNQQITESDSTTDINNTDESKNPIDTNKFHESKFLGNRQDIKVLSRAYIAILESKKAGWVKNSTFCEHKSTSVNCFSNVLILKSNSKDEESKTIPDSQNSTPQKSRNTSQDISDLQSPSSTQTNLQKDSNKSDKFEKGISNTVSPDIVDDWANHTKQERQKSRDMLDFESSNLEITSEKGLVTGTSDTLDIKNSYKRKNIHETHSSGDSEKMDIIVEENAISDKPTLLETKQISKVQPDTKENDILELPNIIIVEESVIGELKNKKDSSSVDKDISIRKSPASKFAHKETSFSQNASDNDKNLFKKSDIPQNIPSIKSEMVETGNGDHNKGGNSKPNLLKNNDNSEFLLQESESTVNDTGIKSEYADSKGNRDKIDGFENSNIGKSEVPNKRRDTSREPRHSNISKGSRTTVDHKNRRDGFENDTTKKRNMENDKEDNGYKSSNSRKKQVTETVEGESIVSKKTKTSEENTAQASVDSNLSPGPDQKDDKSNLSKSSVREKERGLRAILIKQRDQKQLRTDSSSKNKTTEVTHTPKPSQSTKNNEGEKQNDESGISIKKTTAPGSPSKSVNKSVDNKADGSSPRYVDNNDKSNKSRTGQTSDFKRNVSNSNYKGPSRPKPKETGKFTPKANESRISGSARDQLAGSQSWKNSGSNNSQSFYTPEKQNSSWGDKQEGSKSEVQIKGTDTHSHLSGESRNTPTNRYYKNYGDSRGHERNSNFVGRLNESRGSRGDFYAGQKDGRGGRFEEDQDYERNNKGVNSNKISEGRHERSFGADRRGGYDYGREKERNDYRGRGGGQQNNFDRSRNSDKWEHKKEDGSYNSDRKRRRNE